MPQTTTTEGNILDNFDGVVIPVEDIAGKYQVPGWKCRECGWTVGTMHFPIAHNCPEDGNWQQRRLMTLDEARFVDYMGRLGRALNVFYDGKYEDLGLRMVRKSLATVTNGHPDYVALELLPLGEKMVKHPYWSAMLMELDQSESET